MLKLLNTKKIKNFSFTSAEVGVAKIANKKIFCYAGNFFLTVSSGFNRFLLVVVVSGMQL